MGKNKKMKAVEIAGVMITGASYNCFATTAVIEAVNNLARADKKVQESRRKMQDKRTVYREQGFGAEQIKDMLKGYAEALKDAEKDRAEAVEAFKACANYTVYGGRDEFHREQGFTTRNVFDDIYHHFKLFHDFKSDDFSGLVYKLGFTPNYEELGSKVADDFLTIIRALSTTANYRKYAGKLDKDGTYNAVDMLRAKEFKEVNDIVLAVRAVVVDFWKANKHFTRLSDGSYDVPSWAFIDGVYDDMAEAPEIAIEAPEAPEAPEDWDNWENWKPYCEAFN